MGRIDNLIAELSPHGVDYRNLGELCEIKTGRGITKKDSSDQAEYPIISGGKEPMGYYDNYNRPENTVTVSRVGANAGFVNFIDSKFYLNDKCFSIVQTVEFYKKIMSKFLFYFLKTIEPEITNLQSEGGVPTINTSKLSKLVIPIPPLEVQEGIVNILDTFTKLGAELEVELRARHKQYEYYRGELLTFNEEVQWKTVKEIADVYTGGEPPVNCIKGSIPIEEKTYPIYGNGVEVYGFADSYRIDRDAVTISSIGANTGSIYFRKAFFTPIIRLKVLIPKDQSIMVRFLFHFLSSIKIGSKKSSVPNMNANEVKSIKIPLPPLIEQKRIVTILDKFDALVNDISIGLPAEIDARKKQYEYYRDKLLTFTPMENANAD